MLDSLRFARLAIYAPLLLNPLYHAYAQQTNPVREMVLAAGIGSGKIESLSFSPDSQYLAVLTNIGFNILDSQTGRVRNSIVRYRSARAWNWQNSEVQLCWSPDGKQIAIASRELEIWDPFGQAPVRTLHLDDEDTWLHGLTWSPSGDQIAARTDAGQVVVIDVHSGKRTLIPEQSYLYIRNPSWSPDGRFLATLTESDGESEALHIWDVSQLALIRQVRLVGLQKFGHGQTHVAIESSVTIRDSSTIAWAPKGDALAVDSGLTGLSLWRTSNGNYYVSSVRDTDSCRGRGMARCCTRRRNIKSVSLTD
jgi:WD40 repeat protein